MTTIFGLKRSIPRSCCTRFSRSCTDAVDNSIMGNPSANVTLKQRQKNEQPCASAVHMIQARLSTKLMVLLRCRPTCCHLSSCLLFFRSVFSASVRQPRIQFYRHAIIVYVRRQLFAHRITNGTNSCMESKQSER